MPSHHLLVEILLDVDSRFAGFLSQFDVVRNERFNLRFRVTNVGKTMFPGGVINDIVLREARTDGVFLEGRDELQVDGISPGMSFVTSALGLTSITWDGTVMVSLRVKSRGPRARVMYYQQRNTSPIPGREWTNFFHSANRETILLIEMMDRVLRQT